MVTKNVNGALALSRKAIRDKKWKSIRRRVKINWELYLIIAIPLIWLLVFCYYPMYGVQIDFENLVRQRYLGSPVGFDNFVRFFKAITSQE